MVFISNLMQYLITGAQTIYEFLTIDLGSYLGTLSSILSKFGINLSGLSFLGLIGGIGLFGLIIYSIIK